MAVAYVDSAQTSPASDADPDASQTFLCNIPAGAAAGNLAIMAATDITSNTLNSLIAGWTEINTLDEGDSTTILAWKILTSADITAGSFTFTNLWSTAAKGDCSMICYSGVDQSTPINISANASGYVYGPGTISGPTVTPTVNNCMVVQIITCDITTGTYTATPDGTPLGTERSEFNSTADRQWFYAQDYLQSTAASIDLDADIAQEDFYSRWHIAIQPPQGSGNPLSMEKLLIGKL